MTIIDTYLNLQKDYSSKYGCKTLVIMEVGSFYEMYGIRENDILQDVSQLLNIVLTKRDKKNKDVNYKNPYMVGFTSISLSKYLKVLLNHNYTVVKVDQITEPPNPKRDVTRIYSPSTSIDDCDIKDTNYMLCLFIETFVDKLCIGMSLIDITTGRSIVYEVYDSKNTTDKCLALQEAYRFIYTFHPKELIIYAENCNLSKDYIVNYLELNSIIYHFYDKYDNVFKKISYQNEFLSKTYNDRGLLTPIQFLDLERYEYIRISFILLLQFAYEHDTNIIRYINKPTIYEKHSHLILSNNSIQQLNLIKYDSIESNSKFNSLFDIVNNCKTAIGKRYMKEQLLNPILNIDELNKKYDQIEELRIDDLYLQYSNILSKICDIERVQRKLILGVLNPFEFYILDSSYANVQKLISLCDKTTTLDYKLETLDEYIDYYNSIFDLEEMSNYSIKDIYSSFFKRGIYPEIDKLQNEIDTNKSILNRYTKSLSNLIDTNNDVVKLDKTDKEGYYINITNKRYEVLKKQYNSDIVIDYHVFKLSDLTITKLNSNVKMRSPLFNKIANKIMSDCDQMKIVMKKAYIEQCTIINSKYNLLIKKISRTVGELDMVVSNTRTSILYNYTKPQIDNSCDDNKSFLHAFDLRHPITEQICSNTEYVPNDIFLGKPYTHSNDDISNNVDITNNNDNDNQSNKCVDGIIITGLNGVGKSVLIKMVATSIIMAQCGMYVPSSKFIYRPYNHVISRIGNADNILMGQSTFVKEMMELSTILKRSTPNTLIIADELCSGSEYMSAQAILASTIITLSKIKCSFLFTTHIHNIVNILKERNLENIDYYYLDVECDKVTNDIIYHRKLKRGTSDVLYGIEVSKFIIHDNEFISLANNIRNNLLQESNYVVNPKVSSYNKDIYVHECNICNKQFTKTDLDVHHIKFQSTADSNGFINHQHKNVKSNLAVLCTEHHNAVHNNQIVIKGWKESTEKGLYLDYENVITKKNKLKYSQQQIDLVKSIKNDFLTLKDAQVLLDSKYKLKVSSNIISKIWKNTYGN
jgi:DNA mismatch repair protein MutS